MQKCYLKTYVNILHYQLVLQILTALTLQIYSSHSLLGGWYLVTEQVFNVTCCSSIDLSPCPAEHATVDTVLHTYSRPNSNLAGPTLTFDYSKRSDIIYRQLYANIGRISSITRYIRGVIENYCYSSSWRRSLPILPIHVGMIFYTGPSKYRGTIK